MPTDDERRTSTRHDCLLPVHGICEEAAERFEWQGVLLDVSRGGVQLLLNRPLTQGAWLDVEFETPQTLPLRAQVMHAVPYAAGGWLTGCRFSEPLADERVQSLITE